VLVIASDDVADVALTGVGRDDLEVELPEGPVRVAPRTTVRVPVRVRAPRVRLVGSRRRHSYTVTATGRSAPQHVQGNLSVRPLVGSGLARVVGVVSVLALWLAGVSVALPYLADRFADRSTSVDRVEVAVDDPGAEPTDGAPGPGAPGPGAGGDGQGEEAPGDETDETPDDASGVRAAGQITGPSPGGATVTVLPAASLWDGVDDAPSSADARGPGEA